MPISINAVLAKLKELGKVEVEIYGTLDLEFEGMCITHVPKKERHTQTQGSGHLCESSIWTNFNLAKMGITEDNLKQFDGKIVVVTGYLNGPKKGFDGCGHFGSWPAEINATNIRKYKNET